MGCSTERTIEKIPEKNKGYPVCRLTVQLTDEIDCLVSYDSNRLLLGGKEEFQMFDIATKNISTISKEHKGRINCLIKLENNKVVSGSQDKTIKIWDIEKKECLYTLEGHTSIIWEIKSLTKNRLISAADDNTSRIWNLDKKSSEYFYRSKRHISSIAVLDNNRVLLTSGKNILLFDINTKESKSYPFQSETSFLFGGKDSILYCPNISTIGCINYSGKNQLLCRTNSKIIITKELERTINY